MWTMTENARRQLGNCGLMERSDDGNQEKKKFMDSRSVNPRY